jgi:hypothetical protein
VEDIVREPVEMIDADLDAVAGGFFNGSFNAFSFITATAVSTAMSPF